MMDTTIDKRYIYFSYCTLPVDDGTFSDYLDYYMNHPQSDLDILKRACIEISEYCHFCMRTCVFYKSKKYGNYTQFKRDDGDELDFNDYKINLFYDNINIYKDTDLNEINISNIEGLVNMISLGEPTYREIFKRLLRGETFLNL